MTTLCLADLELIPCDQQPKGNEQPMLHLMQILNCGPERGGISLLNKHEEEYEKPKER